MKLKIPPAIQTLVFAILMWLINRLTYHVHIKFENQQILSWTLFCIGVLIGIIALYNFKKSNTTVDPTKPEKASQLVSTGIYKFSRNPMYLAMFFVLLALAIQLGNIYSLAVLILYVWFITRFQIKPEEEVLTKLFGESYINYSKKVRRWL
jgi:protein-S-isoprenylcysteine O-methyltransferase Ste14